MRHLSRYIALGGDAGLINQRLSIIGSGTMLQVRPSTEPQTLSPNTLSMLAAATSGSSTRRRQRHVCTSPSHPSLPQADEQADEHGRFGSSPNASAPLARRLHGACR